MLNRFLAVFCLVTIMKSSNRLTMLRFHYYSSVEYDKKTWFIKAFS